MLPIIVYDEDANTCSLIRNSISEYATGASTLVRLYGDASNARVAAGYIDRAEGIQLLFIGLGRRPDSAFDLGRLAHKKNRDSYVVYMLSSHEQLDYLAESGVKTAGIMIKPIEKNKLVRAIMRLETDYKELCEDETDEYVVLNSQGSTFRLPLNRILYFEAVEKKVTIWTEKQSLSVRMSLGAIEEMLPAERFLRCHLSYLVNSEKIDSVDFANMSIKLINGDEVYYARSYKDTIKKLFGGKEGGVENEA